MKHYIKSKSNVITSFFLLLLITPVIFLNSCHEKLSEGVTLQLPNFFSIKNQQHIEPIKGPPLSFDTSRDQAQLSKWARQKKLKENIFYFAIVITPVAIIGVGAAIGFILWKKKTKENQPKIES